MGVSLTISGASFPPSLGFNPAGDSSITDWYVFGDRTGAGNITGSLTNQAAGATAPTVSGQSSIIVNGNNIVLDNTKSEIISNADGTKDLTLFAVVSVDFFNISSGATGQDNPVADGDVGIIPFGNIGRINTDAGGFAVQANAMSASTYQWNGYVGNSSGNLNLLMPSGPHTAISSAPTLVALTQSVSTKTLTFYDLTNNPSGSYSMGDLGNNYAPEARNILVGSSYGAQFGGAPCLEAKLSFWGSYQRAMTQPEIQDAAAKIRRTLKMNGLIVG